MQDTVRWEKLMYPYLQNGIVLFTNPTKVTWLLTDQIDPVGKLEIFEGDGGSVYTLSTTPAEDSDFVAKIGLEIDYRAEYDPNTKRVTFSKSVPVGTKCSFEWYFCGKFNTDFLTAQTATVSVPLIESRVKDILARATIISWAEEVRSATLNGARDILTDTDFKMYSQANQLLANTTWINQLNFDLRSMQNKWTWDLLSTKYHGGDFYV